MTGHCLVAANAAVHQFQQLLEQFGGPVEKQRWQALLSKLQVYDSAEALQAQGQREQGSEAVPHLQSLTPNLENRVTALQAISAAQKEVFAVGDGLHAITLTANAKGVECAARQGVQLEVFTHRAVWLTGL